jgi:hypothetical protein
MHSLTFDAVYAMEADASGSSYIAGFLAVDLSSSQPGSAFVAKYDGAGAPAWAVTIGSATSKDTFFGLALSHDSSKVYAVGRVGSTSNIFTNVSNSRNIMRPLLAIIATRDGAMSTRTPTPLNAQVDEEVRAVVVDPRNTNKALAGGMASTAKKSSLIYGLEAMANNDGQTLELKSRIALQSGDMAPVVAVSTAGVNFNGARRFYAVAGCYLHVIEAVDSSSSYKEVGSVMLQEQNTCLGSATDVRARVNGDPVVMLLTPSKSAMILQYRANSTSAGYTNKAASMTVGNSQAKGRVVSGTKSPESVLIAVSNVATRKSRAVLAGLILSNNTSNDVISSNRRLQRAQLIVKLATLGGTGLVLIVTVFSVFLITRHAKRSGEPA